ncbi:MULTISPECIES: hypothetical protein [unclassified Psychrobacter]|uniref:hypothetical protein n=1 Tax=unclassified Psychrobacter TaxID=196806 RepID=UPI0025E2E103|nr:MULTISPECIES: hypothetical protein [unclassified Psychrobacter]
MKINQPHLFLVLVSFGLVVSGCNNIKKVQPEMYAEKVASEKITEPDNSNDVDKVQMPQGEGSFPVNPASKTPWSTLDRDEQVNEIKRIVVSYGGELQGLGYSDAKILETADIYVLNADISEDNHLQLTQTLSELVGAPIVINILDSRMVDEMGSLETLELSAIDQNQIANFSIYNNEHINSVARIVETHGAKLQSLGYSGDSELSLQISYYPKKLTKSDFENLERALKQLTGINVTVFRKSVTIKPL